MWERESGRRRRENKKLPFSAPHTQSLPNSKQLNPFFFSNLVEKKFSQAKTTCANIHLRRNFCIPREAGLKFEIYNGSAIPSLSIVWLVHCCNSRNRLLFVTTVETILKQDSQLALRSVTSPWLEGAGNVKANLRFHEGLGSGTSMWGFLFSSIGPYTSMGLFMCLKISMCLSAFLDWGQRAVYLAESNS